MSEQVIDERVVSMKFDNEDFEKNTAQSLTTIQKLKQALNFKDSAKGLDEIEKASKKIDLSHIGESVDAIKQKFNGWEVAARAAITNVTNSAFNAAKRMVESVTIDPIRTGMTVYEQKLNSVQTMINNSGKSLSEVTQVLDELNEYSDKTIFSLNDMTTALGKFTAQGVDIKKAATIIKGAANEAATMGAGSAEFSRFIYNLTQAYGMGKMTTIDWKSLENAGVAGREFKEQLIESAKVLGTIDEKGMYKGQLVTTANLREFLKDGIITAEVMTDTFEKYAGVKEGFEDFGKKALSAAQDVKTFHQLLDVLAESVASTWSQSFGYIIGNFYEAKQLWTNVSKMFDQSVGRMNESRNKLLKDWYDGFIDPAAKAKLNYVELQEAMKSGDFGKQNTISGRKLLLDSLANTLQAILQVIKPVKEAFREFFPATTAKNLWEATYNLREFTSHLKLSQGAINAIKDAFRGFFAVFKFGRTLLKDILGALIPATKEVDSLAVIILKIAGLLGRTAVKFVETVRASEGYQNALKGISSAASLAIKIVGTLVRALFDIGKYVKETGLLQKAFTFLGTAISKVVSLLSKLAPVATVAFKVVTAAVGGLFILIGKGIGLIEGFFSNLFGAKKSGDQSGQNIVAGVAQGVENSVGTADKSMVELAKGMIKSFCDIFDMHSPSVVMMGLATFIVAGLVIGLAKAAGMLSQSENQILQFVGRIGTGIANIASNIKDALFGIGKDSSTLVTHMQNAETALADTSVGLLDRIGGVLRALIGRLKSFNIAAVVVIGIIGLLLANLTSLIMTVYNFVDGIRNGFRAANKVAKGFNNFAKAFKRMHSPLVETLKGVALCVMGIAASIWLLSTLKDTGKLAPALVSLLISFTLIMGVIVGAAAIAHNNDLTNDIKNLAMMVLAISASFVLLSFAFEQINSMMSDSKTTFGTVASSLGILLVIGAMLVGAQVIFSKFNASASVKDVVAILAWTFSVTRIVKALMSLIEATAPLRSADIGSVWLGGILPILTLMGAIAVMGLAFKDTGVGSALTVMAMIVAVKAVINTIAKIPWDSVVEKINSMKNTLIFLGILIMTLVGVLSLSGEGFKDFAKGLVFLMIAIGGMVLICKAVQKLELSDSAINQAIKIAAAVGLLAAALIITMHFADVPVGKFTGFSLMLLALNTVMLTMANVVQKITSCDWGSGVPAFKTVALCMTALVGALAVLAYTMKFTENAPVGKFALVILALMGVIFAVAGLAKAIEGLDGPQIAGVLATLLFVFLGIGALLYEIGQMKSTTPTKPLIALIGGLLVVFGSLILLTLIPTNKLISTTIMLTVVMLAFAGLILAVSELKAGTPTGPLVALVAGIVVIAGSLMLLAQYSVDQLLMPVLSMVAVMAAFALMIAAMKGIKAESTGPMLVAVIAILAIGASLGFLAMMDWPGLLDAAISMSLVLGAVAAALFIVSKAGGTDALKSSAAIIIVSAAMVVLSYAMQQFASIPWEAIVNGSFALLGLTAAIALLALIGKGLIEASAALLIGSITIVILSQALQQFALIPFEAISNGLFAVVGLAAAIALLAMVTGEGMGAVAVGAGLLLASIGLIAVAKAMQMFAEVSNKVGGGYLAGIGEALMRVGLAGVVMTAGAAGLILGGTGLLVIASALKVMSKVSSKVNGSRLTGIADGLMMIGLAGVVLTLGAAGLIVGGVGLLMVASGLALMSNVQITGKKLFEIGKGLIKIATAGIIGIIGGPGLILLSVGIIALVSALSALAALVTTVFGIDIVQVGNQALDCGKFVIGGLIEGIVSGFAAIIKTVLNLGKLIINTFCNLMGIHSNSDAFIDIGKFILGGLGEGLTDKLMNGDLSDTMKGIADNLLGSFTGELGSGFGKIGELFNKFDKKEKKWVKTGGHYEYGRGYVEEGHWEETEKSIFGDFTETINSLTEGFTHVLDDNTFTGENGLLDWVNDLDFSVGDVTSSMKGLDGAIGDVGDTTTQTTKSFSDGMSVFSEFSRKMNTTVSQVKKNLMSNVLGFKEYQTMVENLQHLGYDKRIKEYFLEEGFSDQTYQYLQAMMEAARTEEGMLAMNKQWLEYLDFKNGGAEKWTEQQKALTAAAGESVRDMDKVTSTYGMMSGQTAILGETIPDNNIFSSISEGAKATTNDLVDSALALEAMNTAAEKDALRQERIQASMGQADQNTADKMIQDFTESVQNALGKYFLPSKFEGIGQNICAGLVAGILSKEKYTLNEAERFAKAVVETLKTTMKIESPSKITMEMGEYLDEGLAIGLDKSSEADKSAKEMGKDLLDQFRTVLYQIMDIMETDDAWQPTIRPVVDFSNIQAGASEAQNTFNGVRIGAQVTAAANDIQAAKNQTYGTPTVAGMSKEEFRDFLTEFAETIVEGITSNDGKPVEVNVNLEGDAKGIFNVVRDQNTEYKKTSGGRSALA